MKIANTEKMERFKQFKTNKTTLAFIVNPLNSNSNEIHVEPFGIHTGSLEMQLIDLKCKALYSGTFPELKSKLEELEVQKCMYVTKKRTALKEMPRIEGLIFDAWNSLPDCYSKNKAYCLGDTYLMILSQKTEGVTILSSVQNPNNSDLEETEIENDGQLEEELNSLLELPHNRDTMEELSEPNDTSDTDREEVIEKNN
ncbi:unnamed protein product [Diabrotica balteata]|uniref:Uncharacterized protein n=1 Tax=Diabrotica balteata TaxID=107213 RepID=A0A9N9SQL5_DIABA|nr:unnamed protein product [Diabrotica balteata]